MDTSSLPPETSFARIYGLETEYALIFHPSPQGSGKAPRRRDIYREIEEAISQYLPHLKAKHVKQGIFLANGGFIHYEAQASHYLEGLIEASTPECISPRELVYYQAALDRLLIKVLPQVEENLALYGYPGQLIIGKNTTDNKGNYYGCHENYWVRDPLSKLKKFFLALGVSFFLVLSLPFFFISILPFLIIFVFLLLAGLVYLVGSLLSPLPLLGKISEGIDSLLNWFYRKISQIREEDIMKIYGNFCKYLFYPLVIAYSLFLSLFLFRKIRRQLTSHLITRQIYTGSGRFSDNGRDCHFSLSQKAEAIYCQFRIFWDDLYKPLYDVKNFVLSPFSVFQDRKRLHLMAGEANMAPVSNYLKVATTSLILDMIEEGHPFSPPRFRRPIKTLRSISRDWEGIESYSLWGGGEMSAWEVQSYYLEEAKKFHRNRKVVPLEVEKTLNLWEETLEELKAKKMSLLSRKLDWAMKKAIFDQALWGGPGLKVISRALPLIYRAEKLPQMETWEDLQELEQSLEEALAPEERREWERELARSGLDWNTFLECYQRYFQLQKIDLKYHELNQEEGYFFKFQEALEEEERWWNEEELERCFHHPPSHTRAHLRGYFVQLLSDLDDVAEINWDQLIVSTPITIRISLGGPLNRTLDEEQREDLQVLLDLKRERKHSQW